MSRDALSRQLEFLRAIDTLKGIERASPILDRTRRENSAEHSWHLAMYALVLAEHAPADVDIGRVVQMLLLHDIVEIDAGDMPIHGGHLPEDQRELESRAADRLYGLLPDGQRQRFRALWDEFEAAQTPDARFAKSLDRLQPLIQNVATGGGTWSDYGVTEQQVIERYGPPIRSGSPGLWRRARALVRDFFRTTA